MNWVKNGPTNCCFWRKVPAVEACCTVYFWSRRLKVSPAWSQDQSENICNIKVIFSSYKCYFININATVIRLFLQNYHIPVWRVPSCTKSSTAMAMWLKDVYLYIQNCSKGALLFIFFPKLSMFSPQKWQFQIFLVCQKYLQISILHEIITV